MVASDQSRCSTRTVLGRSEPIKIHSDDRLWSLCTWHIVLYNIAINNPPIRRCQSIIPQVFPNHQFTIFLSELLYCLLTNNLQFFYIFFDIAMDQPISDSSIPSRGIRGVLIHVVAGLRRSYPFIAKSSNEVLENVLRRFDRIVSMCVAAPVHSVSVIIAFTHMTHNVIECVFLPHISKIFCSSLSSSSADSVVSGVDRLVWCVLVVSLCDSRRWWCLSPVN